MCEKYLIKKFLLKNVAYELFSEKYIDQQKLGNVLFMKIKNCII